MAGCFGSSAEDRHRERELDRYIDAQDAAEKREQAIEEAADELMREGKECSQFLIWYSFGYKHFNFSEGVCEIPDDKLEKINELFAKAESTQLNADFAAAAIMLNSEVKAYWKRQAVAVAEERMK